jgi:hypothetical protein
MIAFGEVPTYVTTGQAAAELDVSPSLIRTWASRGLLAPVGRHNGRPMYAMVDVWAVEKSTRTHRGCLRNLTRYAPMSHDLPQVNPAHSPASTPGFVTSRAGDP